MKLKVNRKARIPKDKRDSSFLSFSMNFSGKKLIKYKKNE